TRREHMVDPFANGRPGKVRYEHGRSSSRPRGGEAIGYLDREPAVREADRYAVAIEDGGARQCEVHIAPGIRDKANAMQLLLEVGCGDTARGNAVNVDASGSSHGRGDRVEGLRVDRAGRRFDGRRFIEGDLGDDGLNVVILIDVAVGKSEPALR